MNEPTQQEETAEVAAKHTRLTARDAPFVFLWEAAALCLLALLLGWVPGCAFSDQSIFPRGILLVSYAFCRIATFFLSWCSAHFVILMPVVLVVGVCFLAYGKYRQRPSNGFLIAGVFVFVLGGLPAVSYWAETRYEQAVRVNLSRVAQHASPIITALDAYAAAHETYPANLRMLVPEYLTEIPESGLVAWPEFGYTPAGEEAPFKHYELRVRAWGPFPPFWSGDLVIYWPEGDYLEGGYRRYYRAGYIERPSAAYWRWVHEGCPEPLGDWLWLRDARS